MTLELLGTLVDAGGEVAGLLLKAKPRLVMLLNSLKTRGLVFEYPSDTSVTWTAHPSCASGSGDCSTARPRWSSRW